MGVLWLWDFHSEPPLPILDQARRYTILVLQVVVDWDKLPIFRIEEIADISNFKPIRRARPRPACSPEFAAHLEKDRNKIADLPKWANRLRHGVILKLKSDNLVSLTR